jgi:uncharacterized protein (DUF697 family)
MSEKLTASTIQQALDFAYEKAIEGFIGLDSAAQLAEYYKNEYPDDKLEQANALIRWQIAKSAASGFITGFGGFIALPATIPANIASVLFIQLRMIAAISIIGGRDPSDEKVRILSYACLAGNQIAELLKDAGLNVGKKVVFKKVGENLSGGIVVRTGRLICTKMVTKLGAKGMSKIVPVIGGIIGGAMDAVWTKAVGEIAKTCFIETK